MPAKTMRWSGVSHVRLRLTSLQAAGEQQTAVVHAHETDRRLTERQRNNNVVRRPLHER